MNKGITSLSSILNFSQLEAVKISTMQQVSMQGITNATRQVEGLFINIMINAMRATSLHQEELIASNQTQFYTSLYDQQLAYDLSASGLGLAQAMCKQLMEKNVSSLNQYLKNSYQY